MRGMPVRIVAVWIVRMASGAHAVAPPVVCVETLCAGIAGAYSIIAGAPRIGAVGVETTTRWLGCRRSVVKHDCAGIP